MTDPHFINELHSDLRGVKEGWYAIDERGNLLLGPFSNREICLTKSASRGGLMSKVKFISSPTEIPAGQTFILVKYGEESGQMRNSLGLTITVARNQSKTISDLSFLADVHTAKEIAKRESISNIFALK